MIFVILCGGNGTRLFPLSRRTKPKQIHRFISDNTLIQDTILRIKSDSDLEEYFYYFVTNHLTKDSIINNINELNIDKRHYKIIVEPFGRNSSAAILMSTLLTSELEPEHKDKFITILSCDHKWDDNKFRELIQNKNIEKYNNQIITIGINPTTPHVGYGYIKKDICSDLNLISQFKEKPDYETAKKYVESGEYVWNSGTFIFKYDILLTAYQKYAPNTLIHGYTNLNNITKEDNIIYLSKNDFLLFNDVSFDVEIMEKIDNGSVLTYDGFWSDIGGFDAIYDIKDKDENLNVIDGENIIYHNTTNSYIRNDNNKKIICMVGVDNVVVVETNDVLLIMNKNKCQDIKKIIEKIENNKDINSVLNE